MQRDVERMLDLADRAPGCVLEFNRQTNRTRVELLHGPREWTGRMGGRDGVEVAVNEQGKIAAVSFSGPPPELDPNGQMLFRVMWYS